MRLFYFLLSFSFIQLALAADCTTASILAQISAAPGSYDFPACDNLFINSTLDLTANNQAAEPLTITVTGTVAINANIILDGGNGFEILADFTSGPQGGPGAEEGGGISLGEGQPQFGPSVASGLAALADPVCSNGGGGGGFITAGTDGTLCATTSTAAGAGGQIVPIGEFDFAGPFRGGFGGGAGGAFEPSAAVFRLGSGGGGGGAIHINVTGGGTVTIRNGVRISARGGNGGPSTSFGGGGGGGSGGVIWIETTGQIINNGILDVTAGIGGRNTTANRGHGGNGGNGVYRLVSNGGATIVTGNGTLNSSLSSSTSSLNSDISCGTIAPVTKDKNSSQLFLQMMMGFLLVLGIFGIKTRYQRQN